MGITESSKRDEPTIEPKALPCPFCGSPATIEYWHGGGPNKRMIVCIKANEECEVGPMVTGETKAEALANWNGRSDKDAVGRGMAIAAGIAASMGDETSAKEILGGAGYSSVDDLKADGVDEYDIKLCQHVLS